MNKQEIKQQENNNLIEIIDQSGVEKGIEKFSRIFCRGIIPRKKSGFQYHISPYFVGSLSGISRELVGIYHQSISAACCNITFNFGSTVPHNAIPNTSVASFLRS